MFQKAQLSIIDWFLYYVLMAIPLVNFIVFLVLLFSSKTNKTLKSFMLLGIILAIIFVVGGIIFGGAMLAFLTPYLESFTTI